jgi:hypothetical protein
MQLYIIQKVMGALTAEHMELFLRNPRYAGFKFPDMGRPEVSLGSTTRVVHNLRDVQNKL